MEDLEAQISQAADELARASSNDKPADAARRPAEKPQGNAPQDALAQNVAPQNSEPQNDGSTTAPAGQ